MRHAAVYDEEDLADNSAELSLGMGTLIGIFFGLALVCGVFFGFGYMMGHRTPGPYVSSEPLYVAPKLADTPVAPKPSALGTRTAFRSCAHRVAHHKPRKRSHSAGTSNATIRGATDGSCRSRRSTQAHCSSKVCDGSASSAYVSYSSARHCASRRHHGPNRRREEPS